MIIRRIEPEDAGNVSVVITLMYFHIFNAVSWDAIVDTAQVTLRF